jgi:hypothetical protein
MACDVRSCRRNRINAPHTVDGSASDHIHIASRAGTRFHRGRLSAGVGCVRTSLMEQPTVRRSSLPPVTGDTAVVTQAVRDRRRREET